MLSVEHTVSEFIGIYDADSTLVGEISYWVNARLGRAHCSLCDLTHGMFTKKSEWKSCEQTLHVPFSAYHRNDSPQEALDVADGTFPIVLIRTSDGLEIVFSPQQLAEFNGDTTAFVQALASRV